MSNILHEKVLDYDIDGVRQAIASGADLDELDDLGDHLLLDAIGLLDVDVHDLAVVGEVDAGVVAVKATAADHVAAAHHVPRLVDVDVALDIGRHGVGDESCNE